MPGCRLRAGRPVAACERLRQCPASGKIPRKAATDAAHIAIAAVDSMDFLVTWNCAHIANAAMVRALASICKGHACECPVICTPEELLGE